MTVQDVEPETYYLVGERLFELAGKMYDAFQVNVRLLGETGAMAGSDDSGTAWATSYDARVAEVLGAVNDLILALEITAESSSRLAITMPSQSTTRLPARAFPRRSHPTRTASQVF